MFHCHRILYNINQKQQNNISKHIFFFFSRFWISRTRRSLGIEDRDDEEKFDKTHSYDILSEKSIDGPGI